MEEFQSRLDALQKESKELIGQCIRSLVAAVTGQHVDATRLALAIAQRFSPERAHTAYPVVCLLDAMLLVCHTGTTPAQEQAVLSAVLDEVWAVVPPYLGNLAAHKTVLDKSLRLVRRWGQRGLLDSALVDKLTEAMSATDNATTTSTSNEQLNTVTPSAEGGVNNESTSTTTMEGMPSNTSVMSMLGTEQLCSREVAGFQRVLQSCMTLLEQLPPPQAALYCQIITTELPTLPSRAALELLCDLHTNLRAEMLQGNNDESNASAAVNDAREDNDTAPAEARAALAQLLDRLSSGNNSGTQGTTRADGVGVRGREGVGSATAGGFAQSRHALRYVSPLFSDVLQRQTLTQRSGFVERLRRRPGAQGGPSSTPSEYNNTNSSSSNYYYPRPPTITRRPFRIPAAKQLRGGAVRRPFPSVQSWIETNDMAELVLYEARDDGEDGGASLLSMAKKRERDGEL